LRPNVLAPDALGFVRRQPAQLRRQAKPSRFGGFFKRRLKVMVIFRNESTKIPFSCRAVWCEAFPPPS